MECLPDETLIKIFEHLHPSSRLKLELVSRRWLRVMPYEDLKEIDLLTCFLPRSRVKQMDTLPITGALSSLLIRAGENLRKISFGQQMVLITPVTLRLLAESCPNVDEIDLSYCKVTENIVQALLLFADRLRVLSLANTAFSVTDVGQHIDNMCILYSNMERLERVNLQGTNMFNLQAIQYLPQSLKFVNLNNCSPLRRQVLLEFLYGGRELRELRLSAYNALDEDIVEIICAIPTLEVLDLSHMAFGDIIGRQDLSSLDFAQLGNLPNLRELYVQFNSGFTSVALRKVAEHCTQLQVLNLACCRQLDDFWPIPLMLNLKSLTVSQTNTFDDEIVLRIAAAGLQLVNFQATACPITNKGLQALVACCGPILQSISVANCDDISNDGVAEVINRCTALTSLNIQCSAVDDATLLVLASAMSLRKNRSRNIDLDVSFSPGISDKGVEFLNSALDSATDFAGSINIDAHQTKITKTGLTLLDKRVKIRV